ncbi:MAG: DUF3073 domain-containing protein [Promicromonosporaceae bacterium]|nr:DUF3073 domain-containing protein [Promicromonosporaceae bacterium]
MGRGRQKAKQTKVARELKYFTPDTNLTALERELRGTTDDDTDEDDDYVDPYAPADQDEDPKLAMWADFA